MRAAAEMVWPREVAVLSNAASWGRLFLQAASVFYFGFWRALYNSRELYNRGKFDLIGKKYKPAGERELSGRGLGWSLGLGGAPRKYES